MLPKTIHMGYGVVVNKFSVRQIVTYFGSTKSQKINSGNCF